nr:7TM diverse intracellular signaling domain-containing protein [Zunongwangia pacifica]
MKPFETKTLILKTKLQGHSNLYFPTDFTTVEDILIYEANNSFLLGRYFGYFIFTALFNLFLFILIRKKLYGFMFGYILSMMAFNAIEYMYDALLVPDFIHSFWIRFPKMFFVLLASYFHTKVFQYFTAHKEHFPKWNSVLNFLNNFILFILILFVVIKMIIPHNIAFFNQYRLLLFLLFLINLLVLIVNLFYSIFKKNKQALYYICCNFLLILSLLFYITNTFQIGGATIYMPPGNIINSVAFEIISLTIAFLLNYRKELNEMNQNLAAAKLKSEKLSKELIEVQENERQIIARNLHDGLGNTMNALRLLLEAPYKNEKQFSGIFNLAKEQFRTLIYQISPKEIESIGLYKTIRQDLELFKNTPIEVNLTLLGNDHTIASIKAVNMYRIFQELISNIIKHSKATVVDITINCDENTCSLQVEDNGIGLKNEVTKGMGIKNIQSRVSYHQGIFHMENTEKGMISIIEIPI